MKINFRHILFLVFLLLINSKTINGQDLYGEQQVLIDNADAPISVTSADFDNDGLVDILYASWQDSIVAWVKNLGNNNFSNLQLISQIETQPWKTHAADLNNDGFMDALTADVLGGKISYYLNDGSGGFGNRNIITDLTFYPYDVYTAFIDDDDFIDVLSASAADSTIAWYKNNGDGTFGPQQIISDEVAGATSVYAAHINSDDHIDVVSAAYENGEIHWYENDGFGNFSAGNLVTNLTDSINTVYADDLDNDGDIDLLSASVRDNKIAYYKNDGFGNFGVQQILSSSANGASDVKAKDIDNDGDIDIIASSAFNGKIVYFENNNNIDFDAAKIITDSALGVRSFDLGDYDLDGDYDLVSASYLDKKVAYYENLLITNNLKGTVFDDANEDCAYTNAETFSSNIIISAQNNQNIYVGVSDENGNYAIDIIDNDQYLINFHTPGQHWTSCAVPSFVNFTSGNTQILDIPLESTTDCPELYVGISTGQLINCAKNIYHVQYCNFGTIREDSATIEIMLDSFMTIDSASIPFTQTNSSVVFFVDTIQPLQCGTFYFEIDLSCDAELGQNHCVEANIYPEYSCNNLSQNWDGSDINIEASCKTDSVEFIIKNVGNGDMFERKRYYVSEENVIFKQGDYKLNAGESYTIKFPINSNIVTYYLNAKQSAEHPVQEYVAAYIEGCGIVNTPSALPQFPLFDEALQMDISCNISVENSSEGLRSNYVGYGSNHLIERTQTIDYIIYFQNTTLDSLEEVILIDSLSSLLDPTSIIVGASSHRFNFSLLQDGIISFTLEGSKIPSSSVDEAASKSFISFTILPKLDIPEGARIENTAYISLDASAPTQTETIFHTIGLEYIEVADDVIIENFITSIEQFEDITSSIYPNPAISNFEININAISLNGNYSLQILNQVGQLVLLREFETIRDNIKLDVSNYANGIYFLQIQGQGKSYLGKIVIQR